MKIGRVTLSDRASITMHFTRHGDLLTVRALLEDPVYLSEPYVRSRVWQLDADPNFGNGVSSPCEPINELPRAECPPHPSRVVI